MLRQEWRRGTPEEITCKRRPDSLETPTRLTPPTTFCPSTTPIVLNVAASVTRGQRTGRRSRMDAAG